MYRFCLNALRSPTYFNLSTYLKEQGWQSTRWAFRAHFNESHFQLNKKASEQLELKDLLARLTADFDPPIMPLSFCIDEHNWPQVLQHLAGVQGEELIWILKPASLNNGQYIKIFQGLSAIEAHYLRSERLGGPHVLQQYISEPHLLKGPKAGHKYSLRLFVVLTNYAGAFLYPEGYFNVALSPYQASNFTDLAAHLSNEHLQPETVNVIQLPSQQIQFFERFYEQIKPMLTRLMRALFQAHPQLGLPAKMRQLAIFGFDFMMDADLKVWLLEANHGPCFPTSKSHPLYHALYAPFWQNFIKSFVLPIAKHQDPATIEYRSFRGIAQP